MIPDTSWLHVVFVFHYFNADGIAFSYYFNGQLIVQYAQSRNPIGSGSLPGVMTLGSISPDVFQNGNTELIDELIMWDEQLNETQIRHLAASYLNEEL